MVVREREDPHWGKRIRLMLLELAHERHERVTYAGFGEEVALAMEPPREKPFSPQTVQSWIEERGEPSLAIFIAMGKVAGKSGVWFAFGVEFPQVAGDGKTAKVSERPSHHQPARATRPSATRQKKA